MRRRYLQNIYHANVNASLTVANITRIKSGITINIGVSVIRRVKNVIFRILLDAAAKRVNMQEVLLTIQ